MPMQRKQKIEKLMIRKVLTNIKSTNHNRQSKQDTFQLVFDCDFEDALLILKSDFKQSRNMIFHLKIL